MRLFSYALLAAAFAGPAYAQVTSPNLIDPARVASPALSQSKAEATNASCAAVDGEDIAGMFGTWAAALKTKDPDMVLQLYATDAVLLPTLSNVPRTNPAALRAYFVEFLKKEPEGFVNSRTIHIGCNMAFDAGVYTFTLKGDKGERVEVPARFSYVYEQRDGKWMIVHHHSSAMPELVTSH